MCAPCIIVINSCGRANAAAHAVLVAQESFAAVVERLYDNDQLTAAQRKEIVRFSDTKLAAFIRDTNAFVAEQLEFIEKIARAAPEVHAA